MSATNTFTSVARKTGAGRQFPLDTTTNYSPPAQYSSPRPNRLIPMHQTYHYNHGLIDDARQRLQDAEDKWESLKRALELAEEEVWAAKTEYSRINEKHTNAVRVQGNLHMKAKGKDFDAWLEANKYTVVTPDVIAFLSSDP